MSDNEQMTNDSKGNPSFLTNTNTAVTNPSSADDYYLLNSLNDPGLPAALASGNADQIDEATNTLVLDIRSKMARDAIEQRLADLEWEQRSTAASKSTGNTSSRNAQSSTRGDYKDETAPAITDDGYAEQLRAEGKGMTFYEAMGEIERTHGPMGRMNEGIMLQAMKQLEEEDKAQ
ncbi:hypothetical protein I302_107737 [Kwoniella bestiolae CBS 10118]|uniref:Uncharacterized protein n=1 Tax=Kwoniella bestiolae CBS 10118 TaxID=1296100 RepID=A0A1B9FXQ7_9TREE|nr:hypothetical protein I302_06524 [Kwoniella bestiolae CBS 10118]OCF23541.1 hypothetical protein I302_06524 [Kwoniella bestiolae CBS 10118]